MAGKRKTNFIAGIDEAGRGPLAGPVSVGIVVVKAGYDFCDFPELINGSEVKDSKQLSERQREEVYGRVRLLEKAGMLSMRTTLVGTSIIDNRGISNAVRDGINRVLVSAACCPRNTKVLLDGLLRAPEIFVEQHTIIKGDTKEPAIALASIAAKVRRDRYMKRLSKQYPEYALEVHKGYGTKRHRALIKKHGISPIHRKTYVKT